MTQRKLNSSTPKEFGGQRGYFIYETRLLREYRLRRQDNRFFSKCCFTDSLTRRALFCEESLTSPHKNTESKQNAEDEQYKFLKTLEKCLNKDCTTAWR